MRPSKFNKKHSTDQKGGRASPMEEHKGGVPPLRMEKVNSRRQSRLESNSRLGDQSLHNNPSQALSISPERADRNGSNSSRRYEDHPEDIMKPRSNRDVSQAGNTFFKLVPDQWNNVPKIVYEATYEIITAIDKLIYNQKLSSDEFRRYQTQIKNHQSATTSEYNAYKMETKKQLESISKEVSLKFQEKMKEMNSQLTDKINRQLKGINSHKDELEKLKTRVVLQDKKFDEHMKTIRGV